MRIILISAIGAIALAGCASQPKPAAQTVALPPQTAETQARLRTIPMAGLEESETQLVYMMAPIVGEDDPKTPLVGEAVQTAAPKPAQAASVKPLHIYWYLGGR